MPRSGVGALGSGLAIFLLLGLLAAGCSRAGNVFTLQVGQCFDDDSGDVGVVDVAEVALVECGEPHDSEVFATFDLAEGPFPGLSAVSAQAEAGCQSRFGDYVGIAYEESVLFASSFVPSEDSWDNLGDREVVCLLVEPGQDLVGSMRNSGR